MSPFLWIEMTLASLRVLGKTPLLKYRLISWDNGISNCLLKFFKILFGILLGPTALWSSIRFIRSCTSSGSVVEIKKESSLWKFRKWSNLLSVFGIFWRSLSAIDVKNLLKSVARVLLLVTVSLSTVTGIGNCLTNVLKFFVFNVSYRSNSTPKFICVFPVIFKIFLVVVFLTDSGKCYSMVPVNFESFFNFSFFMRIGGFGKLFVYSIFNFYRFQKSFGHPWLCCFFQFSIWDYSFRIVGFE